MNICRRVDAEQDVGDCPSRPRHAPQVSGRECAANLPRAHVTKLTAPQPTSRSRPLEDPLDESGLAASVPAWLGYKRVQCMTHWSAKVLPSSREMAWYQRHELGVI